MRKIKKVITGTTDAFLKQPVLCAAAAFALASGSVGGITYHAADKMTGSPISATTSDRSDYVAALSLANDLAAYKNAQPRATEVKGLKPLVTRDEKPTALRIRTEDDYKAAIDQLNGHVWLNTNLSERDIITISQRFNAMTGNRETNFALPANMSGPDASVSARRVAAHRDECRDMIVNSPYYMNSEWSTQAYMTRSCAINRASDNVVMPVLFGSIFGIMGGAMAGFGAEAAARTRRMRKKPAPQN